MKNRTSKILITGGAGYIGSHVLVELLLANQQILVIDNFENSYSKALEQVFKITKKNFDFLNIDIKNVMKLDKVFKDFKPDIVFHLAGKKNVLESKNHPIKYYHTNVIGVTNILSKMDEYDCKKLLLSSSASVYGNPDKIPISEKCLVTPLSVYAKSKFFMEEIVKDWSHLNDNRKVIILRYFNPAGNHYSGEIGEVSRHDQSNLFPSILKVLDKKKKYFNIYGNDLDTKDGSSIRDYIHVSDLAKVHVSCLEYFNEMQKCDVFNIGSGIGTSVKEIIEKIEHTLKKQIPIKICDFRDGEMPVSIASIKKANKLLKWDPKENLDSIIKDLIEWKSKYPNGYV